MVGEHNIKVGAVLTHQASLLGWVRPNALLLWASVDLGLMEHRLVGIAGWVGLRCATLTLTSPCFTVTNSINFSTRSSIGSPLHPKQYHSIKVASSAEDTKLQQFHLHGS
jgi:hypothetical protein